jgi:hypothetical protein
MGNLDVRIRHGGGGSGSGGMLALGACIVAAAVLYGLAKTAGRTLVDMAVIIPAMVVSLATGVGGTLLVVRLLARRRPGQDQHPATAQMWRQNPRALPRAEPRALPASAPAPVVNIDLGALADLLREQAPAVRVIPASSEEDSRG